MSARSKTKQASILLVAMLALVGMVVAPAVAQDDSFTFGMLLIGPTMITAGARRIMRLGSMWSKTCPALTWSILTG